MSFVDPTCEGLVVDPRVGNLTISGISLCTPAWICLDLRILWEGADQRGSDRIIPGSVGVLPFLRRPTVTKRNVPMAITGCVNQAGAPNTNPYAGLEANIAYLRANVTDPTLTGDGTRAAVLTMPSGATRSGNVHVLGLTLGNAYGPNCLATLDLSIPLGALA